MEANFKRLDDAYERGIENHGYDEGNENEQSQNTQGQQQQQPNNRMDGSTAVPVIDDPIYTVNLEIIPRLESKIDMEKVYDDVTFQPRISLVPNRKMSNVYPGTIDPKDVIYIKRKDSMDIMEYPLNRRNSKQIGASSLDTIIDPKSEKVHTVAVPKTGWKKHGGIIFAFIGSITVTLASLLVKVLDQYDPFTLGLYRYVGSLIFTLPFMWYVQYWKKESLFSFILPFDWRNRQQWVLVAVLVVMSTANCGGFVFRYFAVQYLTVGDGTVLGLSGAIFVIFMSHFFLNEKCTVASIVIALWTFAGVIIIARPPMITGETEFNEQVLIGTMFGIASMLNWAISVIMMRKTRTIHFTVLLFIGNVWGSIQCLVVMEVIGTGKIFPTTWEEGLYLFTFAALSFIGAVSVIFAMKYDSAVTYSLIRSGDILFAYFWQFIFLAVVPDVYSIIGATIVVTGILLSTFRKWVGMPGDNKVKRMFSFIK